VAHMSVFLDGFLLSGGWIGWMGWGIFLDEVMTNTLGRLVGWDLG
jgi:hypothetical protein